MAGNEALDELREAQVPGQRAEVGADGVLQSLALAAPSLVADRKLCAHKL